MKNKLGITIIVGLLLFSLAQFGCEEKKRTSRGPILTEYAGSMSDQQQTLLTLLNTIEDWDESNNDDIQRRLVLDRLNDWAHIKKKELAKGDQWTPDAWAKEFPPQLQSINEVREARRDYFDDRDVDHLRETTWMKLISRQITSKLNDAQKKENGVKSQDLKSNANHDLQLATAIFNWTVKNVALESPSWENRGALNKPSADGKKSASDPWHVPENAVEIRHTPYVGVYYGRGTALMRAWVMMELSRQLHLDTVLVSIPDEKQPDGVRPFAIGLITQKNSAKTSEKAASKQTADVDKKSAPSSAESDTEVFLFDPWLGLPIPSEDGKSIATLADARSNPKILAALDLDKSPYPVHADDLKKVVALVAVQPHSATFRMELFQNDLPERLQRAIACKPSQLREKIAKSAQFDEVKFWQHPLVVARARATDNEEVVAKLRSQLFIYEFAIPDVPDTNRRSEEVKKYLRGDAKIEEEFVNQKDNDELNSESEKRKLKLKEKTVKILRRGRLMYLRGDWFKRSHSTQSQSIASDQNKEPSIDKAALHWLMACKIDDSGIDDLIQQRRSNEEILARNKLNRAATVWLGMIQAAEHEYASAQNYLNQLNADGAEWKSTASYLSAEVHRDWAKSLAEKQPTEAVSHLQKAADILTADRGPQYHGNQILVRQIQKEIEGMGKQ